MNEPTDKEVDQFHEVLADWGAKASWVLNKDEARDLLAALRQAGFVVEPPKGKGND